MFEDSEQGPVLGFEGAGQIVELLLLRSQDGHHVKYRPDTSAARVRS